MTAADVTSALAQFVRAHSAKLDHLLGLGWERLAYEGQWLWTMADVVLDFPGFEPMTVIGVIMDFGHMPEDLLAALAGTEVTYYTTHEEPLTPESFERFRRRNIAAREAHAA